MLESPSASRPASVVRGNAAPLGRGTSGRPRWRTARRAVGGAIGDRDRDVRVEDVVDQRDVLVADPLDVVLAEAVAEHRRALGRLDRDDQRAEPLLQVVAGGDRAGGSGRRDEGAQAQLRLLGAHRLEDALERGAGREVVGNVIPELRELVEDHVVRVLGQLVAAVVDLLDVALGARRPDDVPRIDAPTARARRSARGSCPRGGPRRRGSPAGGRSRCRRGSSCRSRARRPGRSWDRTAR